MLNVQIKAMGHALPTRVLTNSDLEKMVDTSNDWIIERTGIIERRIAEAGICTSDLCYDAAVMALHNAKVKPEQLDLIIVATVTPDMPFPSTACIVQKRLEAWNAAAFDLAAGCSGFLYALSVAEKFLFTNGYNYVLVVTSDILSKITDYTDRNTCVLFGDGAGAAVLGRGNSSGDAGILSTYLTADGRGADLLYMPAGGSALPASEQTVREHLHYLKMNGREVFRFASKAMVEVSENLLEKAGLGYQDIDVFIPHQANMRIIKTAMKNMQIAEAKTLITIDILGNMSAASIPVALSMAVSEGKVKPGDVILMVAFGAGLTCAGAIIRWGWN